MVFLTAGAKHIFRDAFEELSATFGPRQTTMFPSITVAEIYQDSLVIEKRLEAKRKSCMRKIRPFLDAVERYSKTIEVLCNGTPFLPLIWAPTKFVLQLASEHETAIDRIATAYNRIGELLPRLQRLNTALSEDAGFQHVLAMIFEDVLKFHKEAYSFLQRPGWKTFFDAFWTGFDRSIKPILKSLAQHSDMIDKEAVSIDIARTEEWRRQAIEDARKQEELQTHAQFQSVLTWLNVQSYMQEDELDQNLRLVHADSCDWIQQHRKAQSWFASTLQDRILWIKGNPGAGKSVLTAHIIHSLEQEREKTVLCYICNSLSSQNSDVSNILKCLTAQLVSKNRGLSAFVHREYIQKGLAPSIARLKALISHLISSAKDVRIVIDGVDECSEEYQGNIVTGLLPFTQTSSTICKILFTSRDLRSISRHLKKHLTVALSDERLFIEKGIKAYVEESLSSFQDQLGSLDHGEDLVTRIQHELAAKADGMWLWVRLVVYLLERVDNLSELHSIVNSVPKRLEDLLLEHSSATQTEWTGSASVFQCGPFILSTACLYRYAKVIACIKTELEQRDRLKAFRILHCLCVSKRPLKQHELLDAVSFANPAAIANKDLRLWESTIDLCKPLIEVTPSGVVKFVHFTVMEYLLNGHGEPIVDLVEAQYDMATSCVAYLSSSLDLIDNSVPDSAKIARILDSFYALHTYANEHWLQHVLDYFQSMGGFEAVNQTKLDALFANLVSQHNTSCTALRQRQELPASVEAFSEARVLFQQSLRFRDRMRRKLESTGEGQNLMALLRNSLTAADMDKVRCVADPTLFSMINARYEELVHALIGPNPPLYVSGEVLMRFKSKFKSSAFICRYSDCPRRTVGFPNAHARTDHEKLRHGRGIFCNETTCLRNRASFRNTEQLQRHMQTDHTINPLPHRFKRGRNNEEGGLDLSLREKFARQQSQELFQQRYETQQELYSNSLSSTLPDGEKLGHRHAEHQKTSSDRDRASNEQLLQVSKGLSPPDFQTYKVQTSSLEFAESLRTSQRLSRLMADQPYHDVSPDLDYHLVYGKVTDDVDWVSWDSLFRNDSLYYPSIIKHSNGTASSPNGLSKKAWICIEAYPQTVQILADCVDCQSRKEYSAPYDAMTHLRSVHFPSAGKLARETFSDQYFEDRWMKEVDVFRDSALEMYSSRSAAGLI